MDELKNIQERVIRVVVGEFPDKEGKIYPGTDLALDLGMDFTDLVELAEFAMALEEEFLISVTIEDVETFQTVQDIIKFIKGCLGV